MTALEGRSLDPGDSEMRQFYFAYGSNMHLQQMATRCPESSVYAIGILHNYKWQTNTRGGGNVVKDSQGDYVEGIVFLVSSSDIETLRQNEGVQQDNFVEKILEVEIRPLQEQSLAGQSTITCCDILAKKNSASESSVPGVSGNAANYDDGQTCIQGTAGDVGDEQGMNRGM